ncbi:uncharacterized transporter [[Candida] jaroonii]|uniref:Uncharacterized transporter n=1 Tax=[Candida] jaroonii TaxID=467808 RepID=A0ACA9Y069_9ASCO|nr:uncharacterized transporter [[Candida] jaroonii]
MTQIKQQFEFKSIYHEILLVFTVFMAQILCQGSITMALSTMDVVLQSFELTVPISSVKVWYMGSFALTVGTFILVSGKLGDLFGLKLVFIIGWIWVAFSSMLCGLTIYSHNIIFLIISRALQGIGFSLLLPCGMGILGNIYPNGFRKNLAFSSVGAAGPIGATLGAIMAAVIAEKSWWPWCFFIITFISISLAILSYIYIPKNVAELPEDKLAKLDILGAFTGITGLVLLNFVLNQGPLIGWGTVYIIVLLILSVFLIVGFFIIELYFATFPLLPKSIFNLKIGLVLAAISLGWGSFGIWQFYYWVILLELRHYSAILTAVSYIPVMVLGAIASFLVAVVIHKIRPSYIMVVSSVGFFVGSVMLAVMPVEQTFWKISFIQLFIITWGMDLSFAAGSIILSDYLPKTDQGIAGSLVSTVVNYSVSFFLGMSSSVEAGVKHSTHDTLKSYRASLYFGIGLSGLGLVISVIFLIWQLYVNDSVFTQEDPEKVDDQ